VGGGTAAPPVERHFGEAASIEQTQRALRAQTPCWFGEFTFHDAARVTTIFGRISRRVEIDLLHKRGMDHARACRAVIQQRDTHVVEEVADVTRRGTTYEEVRQPGNDRRYPRQYLDGAKRVAKRARQLSHVGTPQALPRTRQLTQHSHFDGLRLRRLDPRAVGCTGECRGRHGLCQLLRFGGSRGNEAHLHPDPRRDALTATNRGHEVPVFARFNSGASKRLSALYNPNLRELTGHAHE
jgi:hypothetical protein